LAISREILSAPATYDVVLTLNNFLGYRCVFGQQSVVLE
jgi:hypothetical protein